MRISLRSGEKIYMNGAVFTVDRKVSIELLNDVTFLLESHVMQAADASTPLRQIYFATQLMLMDPASSSSIRLSVEQMFSAFLGLGFKNELTAKVRDVQALFEAGRLIEVLKGLRALFPIEQSIASVMRASENTTDNEKEPMACKLTA